jgi:hypothetical protein
MFRPTVRTVISTVLLISLSSAAFAGRVPDPGIAHSRAEAHGSVRYVDVFAGGELATITVTGDGDTDLDLFVYDEFGNLIASDTDPGDFCVVHFTPRWTGRFTIVVRNLGGVYNDYTLRTN